MKKYLGILAITLLGLGLRLIFIDKPDGMWNDEYISWMIANTPFFNGFWHAVKSQCHMPFYYLYLKFFMNIFGQSDLILRLTSVLTGVISVPVMYFVGVEKDKKTAFACAILTAISSFLIYYSQEVRLYSVLFLFSAINLLYTIKCIKTPSKKNFIKWSIANLLILFTHTIGFVYVFFNIIVLSINLYKQYKKEIISLWVSIFAGMVLLTPLILKIFMTKSFSQWWGDFTISRIGFLFTDYFSPVLTNLTNAPEKFIYTSWLLTIIMLVPAIIAIIGIIKAIYKNKLNMQLFFIAFGVILTLTIASLCGKLVFLTKYSMEIYPILIYLACFGIMTFNNKIIRNILIITYLLFSLGFITFHPYSAPKMRRAEGQKIPMDALKKMNLQKGDIIVLEYYPKERFEKYFDFTGYNTISIHKGNFHEYLISNETYENAYNNGKNIYRGMFSQKGNEYFTNKLNEQIFNNLQPGQSVALVILNSVAFYSPDTLVNISNNEISYNKTPLLFMIFSYVKNQSFYAMMEKLSITTLEQKGSWIIIKFTKLNI